MDDIQQKIKDLGISSRLLEMEMYLKTLKDMGKTDPNYQIKEAARLFPDVISYIGKAMGGPIQGIASLSDTARNMYRGPRGIGAYQQFTNGGGVGVDLNDFNLPPSAEERRESQRFSELTPIADRGPLVEGIEALANVEYTADMQNALSDNVSKLGFDPNVAMIDPSDPRDSSSFAGDTIYINPRYGGASPEIQAHEYRHRGLDKIMTHFKKYPFLYKEKYGQESYDYLMEMLKQRKERIKSAFLDDYETSFPYSDYLHENFAEMFEQDFEFVADRYHQAEDGRVLYDGIHYGPGKQFETLDDWKEANPGIDLELRITKKTNEFARETPDVIKFRDYRVQRDRGELKQKVPKFEAFLQIQEAAGDLMKEIKEGKHKELFSN